MKADYRENTQIIIRFLGGWDNIVSVTNCMTRLRTVVRKESAVNEEGLRSMEDVLGIVHDRDRSYEIVVGPGKSRKYADEFRALGMGASTAATESGTAASASDTAVSESGTAASASGIAAAESGTAAPMSDPAASSSGAATFAEGLASEQPPIAAGGPKASSEEEASGNLPDWREYKKEIKSRQKESWLKTCLKTVGDIFIPLIPGIITAGLCAGFASLIAQAVPGYESSKAWSLIYQLLSLVNVSFMSYMTAWAGYRAAERFGGTPILGGMLGMMTSLEGINSISRLIGLYDEQTPLNSILRTGKGGVLAVIIGVFLLSAVEKKIRSLMPDSVDVIFTPLLSLLICAVPYILVIMPVFGFVSGGIVKVLSWMCMSGNVYVRVIAGYISTAVFLPFVAAGMHHGLVALYSVQLQELGYVTLYPALAMAGAGQVGAALALWRKAKKTGNKKLCQVIAGALPAGLLGIGEPLIYGVTLPLGKPFITAGLGAGFGGALIMAMQVAATTWGPSGLLGMFVMTAGPLGAIRSVLVYLAGLLISYLCSFLITTVFISKDLVIPDRAASEHL